MPYRWTNIRTVEPSSRLIEHLDTKLYAVTDADGYPSSFIVTAKRGSATSTLERCWTTYQKQRGSSTTAAMTIGSGTFSRLKA